ncbi:MAG TPA: chemotaxis protein CheW [Patescibacteria group bacterium]|nr:chemotaxis protein CheW [Patescibacteria group bacterium]
MEEQLVVFRLGKEFYGISIAQVREIITEQNATKLPRTPEFMTGIINIRGKIVPVVELAARLGLNIEKADDRRIMIVETGGQEIGVIVDEVAEVLHLPESAIEEPLEISSDKREHIRGIGKENNRLLILLEVGKLFSPEELKEFKDAV